MAGTLSPALHGHRYTTSTDVTASAASAGEITGNGKWIVGSPDVALNGRSECAYSGRNDTYTGDPAVPDADGFTRTQSWGQVARDLQGAAGGVPGTACNPTAG